MQLQTLGHEARRTSERVPKPCKAFELPEGSTVGRFRIGAEIGRGGYATVYRAFDPWLGRHVAVKVTMKSQPVSRRKAAWSEARALASVNHPHVVTLFDMVREQERDVLVMELVDGASLSELSRHSALDANTVAALGVQLADGLEAIHAAGLVHGDIKPANLRLTADGVLKILDLGVAVAAERDAADVPASRSLAGTVSYMSPERLQGTGGDARADIWSAGAVLFELATGRRAVATLTSSSLVRFVCQGIFPQRWHLASKMSPPLADVIERAMAPEPQARFQSARELGEALERAAGDAAAIAPLSGEMRTPQGRTH